MKRPAAVALCLALIGCGRGEPDPRGVRGNETLLTVSATGRADSRPDEARLQVGVQSDGASAGEAGRLNSEKMTRVTAALQPLGVKLDNLQTRNISMNRIDYGKDRGRFRAYNVVEITIRDMTKVGEAVTAVTEAGANVMSGPDLRVSNREAANKSAYAAAYRAARSRADAYAEAAGLKVARVLAIYDGGESYAPPPPSYARDAMAQVAAPPPVSPPAPFSAGVNSTEVRVRVDFALSD